MMLSCNIKGIFDSQRRIVMQLVDKSNVKNELIVVTVCLVGKSVALQALEDLGYFCVDNLPPILLQKFVDLMDQGNPSLSKVAIGIDLRGRIFNNLRRIRLYTK